MANKSKETFGKVIALFSTFGNMSKQLKAHNTKMKSQTLFGDVGRAACKLVDYDITENIEGLQELKSSAQDLMDKANETNSLHTQLIHDMQRDLKECDDILEKWMNQTKHSISNNELKHLMSLLSKQQEPCATFQQAFKEFNAQLYDVKTKSDKVLDSIEKRMKENDEAIKQERNRLKEHEDHYKRTRNVLIGASLLIGVIVGAASGGGLVAFGVLAGKYAAGIAAGAGAAVGVAAGAVAYTALDDYTQNSASFEKMKSDFSSRMIELKSQAEKFNEQVQKFKDLTNQMNELIDNSEGEITIDEETKKSMQCVIDEVRCELNAREAKKRAVEEAVMQKNEEIHKKDEEIHRKDEEIHRKDAEIHRKDEEHKREQQQKDEEIQRLKALLGSKS